jgi:co-chaperonin GroES (HSP10)
MQNSENPSGLKPLGKAVLIRAYTPERKASVIELPAQVQNSMAMVDNRAVVVEVGVAAWDDEVAPRAAPGDRVLVTKFAGFMATGPADGKLYRLVNDRDIFCAITNEEAV